MHILLETNDTGLVIYWTFHRVLNDDSSRFVSTETDEELLMDMPWQCNVSLH